MIIIRKTGSDIPKSHSLMPCHLILLIPGKFLKYSLLLLKVSPIARSKSSSIFDLLYLSLGKIKLFLTLNLSLASVIVSTLSSFSKSHIFSALFKTYIFWVSIYMLSIVANL